MAFPVVLDANVVYSVALTDFYVTLAGSGLFRLHWSSKILDEALENLIERFPDKEDALRKRFEDMQRAEPAALSDPPQRLIDAMTNDPKDRHVLACAVHSGAEVIVTFDIGDFAPEACEPHFVEAQHPDEFTTYLVDLDPEEVWKAIERMASRRQNPPQTPMEILSYLQTEHLPEQWPFSVPGFWRLGSTPRRPPHPL